MGWPVRSADVSDSTIIYTHTDEAPALATYSLLPIIQAFAKAAGVEVETRDISLAGRILSPVPRPPHRRSSASATTSPSSASWRCCPRPTSSSCPNISASMPQLKAAIDELQAQGLRAPRLPRRARRPTPSATSRPRYDKVEGLGRQPGAARGQLRPPRAAAGEGVRRRATRTRWAPGRPTRRPTSPR